MKALLVKDFMVITKQLRIFLFLILFLPLATGGTMLSFAILLAAALSMTAIAYDERSKWNELSAMMPYSKFELVFSKYLLSYLGVAATAGMALLGRLISRVFEIGGDYNTLQIVGFSVVGALIFVAINLPLLFKFGSEKGRFVFIATVVLVSASGPILSAANPDDISQILTNITGIPLMVLIGLVVVANIASVAIAVKIKKTEM